MLLPLQFKLQLYACLSQQLIRSALDATYKLNMALWDYYCLECIRQQQAMA
jgi:hypothetical protein